MGAWKGEPAAYVNTRRKLAIICTGLNDPDGGEVYLTFPEEFPAYRGNGNELPNART